MINAAMIAEYLWLAHRTASKDEADPVWQVMNRLAWTLSMELPADVWLKIIRTLQPQSVSGVGQNQAIWDVFAAVRQHNGLVGELRGETAFVTHGPGIAARTASAQADENIVTFPGVPHAEPSPEPDRSPEPPQE